MMSRARFNEKIKVWQPYASVAADIFEGDHFYYHQLKGLNATFETEKQALSFGFIAARAWVDDQLSVGRMSSR